MTVVIGVFSGSLFSGAVLFVVSIVKFASVLFVFAVLVLVMILSGLAGTTMSTGVSIMLTGISEGAVNCSSSISVFNFFACERRFLEVKAAFVTPELVVDRFILFNGSFPPPFFFGGRDFSDITERFNSTLL